MVAALCRQSTHPLSRELARQLPRAASLKLTDFEEIVGFGLQANINGQLIRIGNATFVHHNGEQEKASRVYVSINDHIKGYFQIGQPWRPALTETIQTLKKNFSLHLISGDHDKERKALGLIFPEANMNFRQLPLDKLNYIKSLQQDNHLVCMIGDGLNDSGALR